MATTIWSGMGRRGGRATDDGPGHCRYWFPTAGELTMSAVVVTVATSSGWARRHQNTASNATTSATLVPILATCSHNGSDQTGSAVWYWVTQTPAQFQVPIVRWVLIM